MELLFRDEVLVFSCVGILLSRDDLGLCIVFVFIILFGFVVGVFLLVWLVRSFKLCVFKFCFFVVKYFGIGVIIVIVFMYFFLLVFDNFWDECFEYIFLEYDWVMGIGLVIVMVMFFFEIFVLCFDFGFYFLYGY